MPGGARRAPPPLPPNGSVDTPPPLPSRNGPGPRSHVVADAMPPPLPSRPGAAVETADDMYEDMNGGFPKIIDARPNKKITSPALLPPSHNTNSNFMGASSNRSPSPQPAPKAKPKAAIRMWDSFREIGHSFKGRGHKDADNRDQLPLPTEKKRRSTVGEMDSPKNLQQQNLVMEETYEMPVLNSQADQHGLPAKLERRNEKPDSDEDMSDAWSESEFEDVEDEPQPSDETGNDLYEMPEGQDPVQDEVYEQADEVDHCIRPVPPPPSSRKPSGTSFAPMPVHPATLQMGKMKLTNVSQESSLSSQKTTATSNNKPKPPPKPENAQAMGGTSIVKALTQKLNERAKGRISGFEKTEAKETPSEDNSSAGSSSSQPGAQPHIAAKEIKPAVPIHPPKKPARQVTVEEETYDTDDIYDEAVTESHTLYDWYHGQVDRKVAISRVENMGQNGAFLIRESSQSSKNHRYTLVVLCNGKVHNLIIRQRNDGNLALGQTEKPDEVNFSSLKELVEHHRTNNVRLLKEDELVKLSTTPKRL